MSRASLKGLVAALAFAFGLACADAPTEPRPASLIVNLLTPATVRSVTVELSGPGLVPAILVNIPVGADSTARDTIEVTAGSGRRVRVSAFDSAGVRTHAADTTITLVGGINAPLQMRVDPLPASIGITVTFGGVRLTVADTSPRAVYGGDTLRIIASATTPAGVTVMPESLVWATSNPAIATAEAGLIRAVQSGSADIVVSYRGAAARLRIDVLSVDEGLLARYHLDGTAVDASGNGRDGTLIGAVAPTSDRTGAVQRALLFDGGTVGLGPLELTGSFTIASWVRFDSSPAAGLVIAGNSSTDGTLGWVLLTVPCGDQNTEVGSSACSEPGGRRLRLHTGSLLSINPSNTLTDISVPMVPATWYHVAATFDADAARASLYVDGALVASRVGIQAPVASGQAASLGRSSVGGGGPWHGALDEVRIYGRALGSLEIGRLPAAP